MRCNTCSISNNKIHYRHRMDFLTKLKNKVKYSINQLVDDPDAQKYAEDILREEEKKKERKKDTFTTDADESEDATTAASSAVSNVASNAASNTSMGLTQVLGADDAPSWVKSLLYVIQYLLIPLPIAMFIANEMIMYSMPIRLIFFVLTFVICITSVPIAAAFVMYYLLRALYSYYNNNYTENQKMSWRPTIFAMLPVTIYSSDSIFKKLFWRVFSYGNNEEDNAALKTIMDDYLLRVNESFPYFQKLKDKPEFKKNYDEITKYITTVHAAPIVPLNENENATENNHLPPVIKPKVTNTTKSNEPPKDSKEKIENAPLPPVISPKPVQATQPMQATQPVQANQTLPPVISPKNTPPVIAPNDAISTDALPPVIARPKEPNAQLKEEPKKAV